MYKWLRTNEAIKRLADNASIPNDPGNTDWKRFQEWVALGNTPEAQDPPPAPPTLEEQEQMANDSLNGGSTQVDQQRLRKAIFISNLAWRLGVAPGALTPVQLIAERNRIAAIYKNL